MLLSLLLLATAADAPDEIIVTAQRREQAAQDVGIALSVTSGKELAQRGIANINQLQQAVPNLEIEPAFGSSQAQFRIRGVGFQDYASNNSPTVGVYVNEIAYPVPVMTQGLLFDIARIEVLRGPQGTLYGRNTTGGAINIVTNRPGEQFGAGATAEYGRYGAFKGEGYVTGPLAEGLSARIAIGSEEGGGFQHNRATGQALGDADKLFARGLLAYAHGDFSATLDAHGGRDHSENVGLYLLDDLHTSLSPGVPGPVIPADKDHTLTGWSISPTLARDADLPGDKPGRRNTNWGTSLNASLDLGGVKLASITAYDWLNRREYGDYDASSSIEGDVFFGSRVHVFSQEARLSSTGTGPLTWLAGAYYSEQHLDERYFSDFLADYGTYARVTYAQRVRSISGYGQVEYALTPQLKAVGGLRFERETRNLDGFGSAFGGATALAPTNVSTRMTPLTGKLALEYKPTKGVLLYASASKGVKSGGFTAYNTGSASGIAPFKPERLYAYEVGIKAAVTRTLSLDGAGFYYDYRDQQVLDAVCGANGPVGKFANAKRSRIYGVEGSLDWKPGALSVSAYASYKHGDYLDYQALDLAACRTTHVAAYVDKSGQRLPFPSVEVGGSASYAFRLGDHRLTPTASLSYRSTGFSWLGARYDIPHYALVNAELAYGPASGRWLVALWGRNILDKQYDLTRNFFTTANIAQPGMPATYGVRASVRY
jgi:outer membrane receptor protein involved in Fe transport